MHEGEHVSLKDFPRQVDVGGSRDGRPVLKRDAYFDKHVFDEPIGAEEEQQIFSGKFVKIRSRRDRIPLVEIRVGKFTIESVSTSHRNLLLKCHGR